MFQQYRKIDDNIYKLIELSDKFDDENEDIIKKYENKEEGLKEIFSNWEDGDILFIADFSIVNPIWDNNLKIIREMTREELIIKKGEIGLLQDGEKLQDGQIVKIGMPQNEYLRYVWNRELFVWQLATIKEELMNLRKEKILKYAELKKEIEALEELADEFESGGTIELLKLQMQDLKEEIDELLQIIKKM